MYKKNFKFDKHFCAYFIDLKLRFYYFFLYFENKIILLAIKMLLRKYSINVSKIKQYSLYLN